MKPIRILGILACVQLIFMLSGFRSYAAANTFDPATMMDVNQIQRGDKAIGKTVFAGVQISDFHLEIIDVMRQANLGQDMILARIIDGPVVVRQCGVIGGMSGSPVYIRGKLIGAIAWGWTFQKEPIAGITPIRPMLEALDVMNAEAKPQTPPQAAAPLRWIASRPFTIAGHTYKAAAVATPGAALPKDTLPLRPAKAPVYCSGFGPEALKLAAEKLSQWGLEPLAGGGTRREKIPVELEPGAAVGVRFMEGDFDMTAIGTVTWRQGTQILAFGHPLMQLGRVNMPLATAWINEFMPSYMRSNKLGSGMMDVGALQADVAWAIGGRLDVKAPLVPARFEIKDRTRGLTRVYNIHVLDQPNITPSILTIGLAQALEATYNPGAEGTLRLRFEVTGQKGTTFRRENQAYFQGSPIRAALYELSDVLQILEDNRWEPQGIARLAFNAEISNREETAVIEKVFSEEKIAKAGKPLHIHVLLRPDGGDVQEHIFTLQMPEDLPKGMIRVGVSGGNDAVYFRSRFGIMLPYFEALADVVNFVEKLEQNRDLCVVVALPLEGTQMGNTQLMRLPSSISAVLAAALRTDVSSGKDELFASKPLDYVIYGRHVLTLATEDRKGARGTVTESASSGEEKKQNSARNSSGEQDEDMSLESDAAFSPLAWLKHRLQSLPARAWDVAEASAAATAPKNDSTHKPQDTKESKEEEEKEDKKSEERPKDDKTTGKSVIRQPSIWLQNKAEDFARGEAKGIALCSDGGLTLGPVMRQIGRLPVGYIWNVASHKDIVYFATGTPGRIYRLKADGQLELWAEPKIFAIRGLAIDAQGVLYLGTWPGGQIFRVNPDGQLALFCRLPCDYVWTLAFDKSGRLLAGTGPEGRLYRIDASGQAEILWQIPQRHILALLAEDETIFMGCGTKGVLYALRPQQHCEALLSTEDDITALAKDDKGVLYAACAGKDGAVYRLSANSETGSWKTERFVSTDNMPIYTLLAYEGELYAGTGPEGKLLRIVDNDRYDILYDAEMTHLLCLTAGPSGIIGGSGNIGEAFAFNPHAAAEGFFLSSVFDAARPAQWGVMDWHAIVSPGTQLILQTRSGQSPDPEDGSWSGWSPPYNLEQAGRVSIFSPPARYLQYRVQMKAETPKDHTRPEIRLRWISLAYLPANRKPSVKLDNLSVDKIYRGEWEIKWTANDPDKDSLMATLQIRPAGTENWQLLNQCGPEESSFKWNTAALKDGRYDVRIVVSDELANPGAALTGESVVYNIVIDNTPPICHVQRLAEHEGKLIIEGLATDNWQIAEIAYHTDKDNIWHGVAAADGLYDSAEELFRLLLPLDKDGKAKITLRCRDTAGNIKSQEINWPRASLSAEERKP